MTSPETLYRKNVVNELRFQLVTHTTCFDIRFGHYRFLKSGFSAGQILDRLGICPWSGFWAIRWVKHAVVRIQNLEVTNSAFRPLLKHTFFITAATVIAI
jgi:hypothetical protein